MTTTRLLPPVSSLIAGLLRAFHRDTRGVAAIEMAFIFPLMLLIYFGLIDAGQLLSAHRRVTLTASTLADLVTQAPGTITKADIDGFFDAASPIMDPLQASAISLEVFGYTKDGDSAKLAWQHKNAGPSCGAAPSAGEMKPLMAEGNDVIVARVCYDWTPITGQIFGADPIKLDDELALRPRQSAQLTCKCT